MEQYTRNTEGSNTQNRFSSCQVQCTRCILSALLKSFWKNPQRLPHKIQFVQKIQKHFLPKKLAKATYLEYTAIHF